MINLEYTFTTKNSGPGNCIAPDGLFYGNDKFTWNFDIHFPVLTKDYASDQTGEDVIVLQNGSTEKAEAELLKIARLTRSYIYSRIPSIAKRNVEYCIAKDPDLLLDILQAQIEILQTWGGYDSLYTVSATDSEKSIGEAAKNYINSLDIFHTYYSWSVNIDDYREGY